MIGPRGSLHSHCLFSRAGSSLSRSQFSFSHDPTQNPIPPPHPIQFFSLLRLQDGHLLPCLILLPLKATRLSQPLFSWQKTGHRTETLIPPLPSFWQEPSAVNSPLVRPLSFRPRKTTRPGSSAYPFTSLFLRPYVAPPFTLVVMRCASFFFFFSQ